MVATIMVNLRDELEGCAKELGAEFFGVADLSPAHDFVLAQGGEYIAAYPRAISIGVRLVDAVVDELFRHEDPNAIFTYRELYNVVNRTLDRISLDIAKRIQASNYKAYPIFNTTVFTQKLMGAFSHKMAANLAGLGWIGKSCLLITPQDGPRLRWGTILTDAPLVTGEPIENQCGNCCECVDICPPGAFTGVPFNSSEPRDVRFRAQLCRDYMDKRKQRMGDGICGLCVYICPRAR